MKTKNKRALNQGLAEYLLNYYAEIRLPNVPRRERRATTRNQAFARLQLAVDYGLMTQHEAKQIAEVWNTEIKTLWRHLQGSASTVR